MSAMKQFKYLGLASNSSVNGSSFYSFQEKLMAERNLYGETFWWIFNNTYQLNLKKENKIII